MKLNDILSANATFSESMLLILQASEAFVPESKRVSRRTGWLENQDNNYDGEGCLISFVYTNKKNPNEKMYYALSDEEVLPFTSNIVDYMDSDKSDMADIFYLKAMLMLIKRKGIFSNWRKWIPTIVIKGYYEAVYNNNFNDFSHLNISKEKSMDSFLADFKNMEMRGINFAQLIAEMSRFFLVKEKELHK